MTNNPPERNADELVPAESVQSSAASTSAESAGSQSSAPLEDSLKSLLTDLLYPSESDEPVTFVSCYLTQETPLTEVQINEWQMVPPSVFVEERPVSDFWEPVLTEEDWYGDDEKKRTNAFQQLKNILDRNLTGQQFFRQGTTEITVYLLGRQPDGTRAGIQTMVVES